MMDARVMAREKMRAQNYREDIKRRDLLGKMADLRDSCLIIAKSKKSLRNFRIFPVRNNL